MQVLPGVKNHEWQFFLDEVCATDVLSLEAPHQPKHSKRRGAGAMLLQKMESFIQSKGQIGLTPAEQAEVMEIRQILNMDILPTLLQAAQEAQNEIDSLYQRVLDCQVQVSAALCRSANTSINARPGKPNQRMADSRRGSRKEGTSLNLGHLSLENLGKHLQFRKVPHVREPGSRIGGWEGRVCVCVCENQFVRIEV